jgi:hypothetical protein
MRTISLHVSESDYAEFKSFAAQSARPVAALIRDAMARWLIEHRQEGLSLTSLDPVDCGAMLRSFNRAEVADEMFNR